MKKKSLLIATLLVVVATAIAVVSCKKEKQDTLLNNSTQSVKTFSPPEVDDMNAYLKSFKQKMKESQNRRDGETLSLEEAAWHLSSVANYDFANANVEFTDLRYDTLYYQVNVTNGEITLSDLNIVYQSMASDIDAFYQNLDLLNKHFLFIGTSVSEEGVVTVSIITSYRSLDHTWYFSDSFEAGVVCDSFFDENSIYIWNDFGVRELMRVINLLEGRDFIVNENPPQRDYYVYAMDLTFEYMDYIDPYGSPFYRNSRIFAAQGETYYVPILTMDAVCYCLDSYIALPFEYINAHPNLGNHRPVHWNLLCKDYYSLGDHWHTYAHIVKVKIGQLIISEEPNGY